MESGERQRLNILLAAQPVDLAPGEAARHDADRRIVQAVDREVGLNRVTDDELGVKRAALLVPHAQQVGWALVGAEHLDDLPQGLAILAPEHAGVVLEVGAERELAEAGREHVDDVRAVLVVDGHAGAEEGHIAILLRLTLVEIGMVVDVVKPLVPILVVLPPSIVELEIRDRRT